MNLLKFGRFLGRDRLRNEFAGYWVAPYDEYLPVSFEQWVSPHFLVVRLVNQAAAFKLCALL